MPPMRFCLLTTFYPPFNFGGDGIDVERTARALVRRGHQVTVLHDVNAYEWLSGRRLPDQPADQQGVEVIGLRSRLGVLAPLATHQLGTPIVQAARIRQLLASRQPDVVVFNNVSLLGGPGLLSFGGDALRVYVAHEHWLVCPTHVLWRYNREPCDRRDCTRCVLSYRRPPQLWRHTNLLDRQAKCVDLYIARSEFSREKHKEFGFSHPMAVLPYFLPGGTGPQGDQPRSPRPHARPYFLFVGRLTRIKGVDSVVPAFARYPDADLLVVGEGEELESLRAQARDVPNIRFLGRVPNEQLAPYYEHAIAAVVPSLGYETFGIVLIEAFRNRTPVIARRIGPFTEIVETGGGGLLFSTTDDLVAALTRLQHDRVYRDALAHAGYQSSWSRWSEEVVVGRFLALVNDAMAARAHRPA
jgi:glycosyltransferase involved in cell wall biosynthesis